MSEKPVFEGWAILELMGHRRLGGYVAEAEIAGAGMLRIDIPGEGDTPAATQYYAPQALYALTPTTEEIARAVAKYNRPTPVQRWELEPAKPARVWGEPYVDPYAPDGIDDADPFDDDDADEEPVTVTALPFE